MTEPTSTSDLATSIEHALESAPFTWRTLNAIAATEFVPRGLRGNPHAMLACVLMGRELGLGPMQSMQLIDVIDGRPSLSAELMNARIREAGHSIALEELTPAGATITGTRADTGDTATITFSRDMADRAGLLDKRNWQRYPEAMYLSRAISMLARWLFPDVFAAAHAYAPSDLDDDAPPELLEVDGLSSADGDITDSDSPSEEPGADVPGNTPSRGHSDSPGQSDITAAEELTDDTERSG